MSIGAHFRESQETLDAFGPEGSDCRRTAFMGHLPHAGRPFPLDLAGSPQARDQAWTARSEATVRLTETIE
jgi:hypothetical protein